MSLLACLPTVISCKTQARETLVRPDQVPAELRQEWQDLVDAREQDRSSEAVERAADALIEQDPPPEIEAGALLAKAERQFLLGQDEPAIVLADFAAALMPNESRGKSAELVTAIHQTLARALVRGGDPTRGLSELDLLEQWGAITPLELRGARSVALDRAGDSVGALSAYVAWRELLPDESPDAGYASQRISALVVGLDPQVIEELARKSPGPNAAACLRATLGVDPGSRVPAWVAQCRPLPSRIGILLPRTGKLSVLSEGQLAAAVASVEVLGRERPVSVMWRDSGSTPDTARTGALSLVADGAEVIIGPIGTSNVRAAVNAAGDRFLVPGEASTAARGVAPSLDDRARAAVTHALASGVPSVLVMVPDNGYGRRVQKALGKLEDSDHKMLKFISYSSGTTSFDPILSPHRQALSSGGALVVADTLQRTELVMRQLRRSKLRVRGGHVDQEGQPVLVLTLGEGLSPDAYGAKHASLDGVVLVPAAFPDEGSRAFEAAYIAQENRPPDDQALLVWRALEAAWSGASSTHVPTPTLVQIQGEDLVPVTSP